MTAAVDAVVVRWRGGDEVDRCINSLRSHGGPALQRLILVDSGSGDGGGERLASRHPDIEVVLLGENRSFAWAVAQGVERGSGSLLLLLNPDAEIQPETLQRLIAFLSDRPEAVGAVPLLVNPDGSPQHRWQLRRLPNIGRLAMGMPGPSQFGPDGPGRVRSVEQPAASAWLVRRSVWDALGGFDPVFAPAWWEDVDFCARLATSIADSEFPASTGWSVVPSARVVHSGGSSLTHLTDGAFLVVYYRNLVRYADRHHRSHLGMIRTGLLLSLNARAIARPSRSKAYRAAARAVRQWGGDVVRW
jgi:GT2 family glycosyltransferase